MVGFICYCRIFIKFNSYFDFYTFAQNQKTARNAEIISLLLISLYSLKFFQLFESVNVIFVAFKKGYFEYFILASIIATIFLGLSFLTNFIYGEYIFEFRSFESSILMNIKIFILNESTNITQSFLLYFRSFSIAVMIAFVFLLRYFFLNLFAPIFLEYFRVEYDNYTASQDALKDDEEGDMKFADRLKLFMYPCKKIKQPEEVNKANANENL